MASKKFLAVIAALACAASAQAAPVPLTTTVAVDRHLHTAQTELVSVNVNSILAGLGLTSNAIGSGSITVTGHSAGAFLFNGRSDDTGYVQTGTTSHWDLGACFRGNCTVTDKITQKDVTAKYVDNVVDTMWVMAGGALGSDSTDWNQSLTGYGDPEYVNRTGSSINGYTYRYQRERDQLSGYNGDLSVTLDLNAVALADLVSDGKLGLAIWSWFGQFNVDNVRLDFTVEQDDGGGAAEVPVPGSLLLSGLGLAALGMMRRRRKA